MPRLSRLLATAVAAVALAAVPAAAQAPNLSGEWELDAAASSFGGRPGPQKQLLKVEHAEPALKTTTTSTTERGERTQAATYATDGTETKNPGMMGSESASTAKWDKGALAITTKMSIQGNDITANETRTLSDGGKTLTIARSAATPMGPIEMKMVYRRKG